MKGYPVAALGAAWLLLACLLLASPPLASAHAQPTTTVQFDREIVHILDNHCVMCHTEGGPAFPLVTYEQTYAARWKIRQDALNRHMAPWAAVAGYGVFANDNGLTQREIDFLSSWAESYGPRNNGQVYTGIAAAAPQVVRAHFDFSRWTLGNPDLRLPLPPESLAARQAAAIQHETLDPKLTADRWLTGLEYKPGDRRVVHAVSFWIQETGQWLGSWTPWHPFVSLPPGLAYRLPSGSHIAADIHYSGAAAEPAVDHGSLALYFSSPAAAPRAVTNLTLEAKGPAAASGGSRKLLAATTLEQDTNVLALQPQILPGVQSIEVAARTPDGATQVLLFARDIPLDWPTPYVLAQPLPLLKGTRLRVIEHYDPNAALPVAGVTLRLSVCPGKALAFAQPQAPSPPPALAQRFQLSGTVKAVDAGSGRVLVQHGAIPGFMGAMTMFYRVAKVADLKQLAAGDEIQSDVVTGGETGPSLENVKVVKKAP